MAHADEVLEALTAFKLLRDRWKRVATERNLGLEAREDLSDLLVRCREPARAADPRVVDARGVLPDYDKYSARRALCRNFDDESSAWQEECQVLSDYVSEGTLYSYMRRARKVFAAPREPRLPRVMPFADDAPVTRTANSLHVPPAAERVRKPVSRAVRQMHIADAVLIVLGNTLTNTTRARFDLSYTVGVATALHR